jgi:hypothetical protein
MFIAVDLTLLDPAVEECVSLLPCSQARSSAYGPFNPDDSANGLAGFISDQRTERSIFEKLAPWRFESIFYRMSEITANSRIWHFTP